MFIIKTAIYVLKNKKNRSLQNLNKINFVRCVYKLEYNFDQTRDYVNLFLNGIKQETINSFKI